MLSSRRTTGSRWRSARRGTRAAAGRTRSRRSDTRRRGSGAGGPTRSAAAVHAPPQARLSTPALRPRRWPARAASRAGVPPPSATVTHSRSPSQASARGALPSWVTSATLLLRGSTLVTVPRAAFATHTAPPATATPRAPAPTGIERVTPRVTRHRRPSCGAVAQTAPAPTASPSSPVEAIGTRSATRPSAVTRRSSWLSREYEITHAPSPLATTSLARTRSTGAGGPTAAGSSLSSRSPEPITHSRSRPSATRLSETLQGSPSTGSSISRSGRPVAGESSTSRRGTTTGPPTYLPAVPVSAQTESAPAAMPIGVSDTANVRAADVRASTRVSVRSSPLSAQIPLAPAVIAVGVPPAG